LAPAETEERVISAFDDAPIGTSLVSLDGTLLRVNRAYCRITGRTEEELLGGHFGQLVHPDHLAQSMDSLQRFATGELRSWHSETLLVRPDGESVWALVAVSLVETGPGREDYFIVQMEDINARKLAEEQLRKRAAEQATVARLGQRALADVDLSRLMHEAVHEVCETLGADRGVILELLPDERTLLVRAGRGVADGIIGHRTIDIDDSQAGLAVTTGEPVVVEDWSKETRFSRATANEYVLIAGMCVLIQGRGRPFGVISVQSTTPRAFTAEDVAFLQAVCHVLSEAIHRIRSEEETRHRALHDPLTGLPNRTLFRDRLEHALAHAARRPATVAVLFLDLDNFKAVNDTFGHGTGDELLSALTPRLQAALRSADTLARLGGDEFAVLCEDLGGEQEAVAIAERVGAALAEPVVVGDNEHFVSASIGIALADTADASPEALLRDADAAMYRAKERGRARFELFDERLRERTLERLQTETRLRGAIQRGELRLVYQPVVSLADGSLRGVECLLRWEDPDRGSVAPAQFIPIAEQSGLIVPIGTWVLQEACRQASHWLRMRPDEPLKVSVNVSALQLVQPDFADIVAAALAAAGAPPQMLYLELTESVLIEAGEAPVRTLQELRELGVNVVLDDFGTGYSSLSYLQRFPLDILKVDRSFAAGLVGNPQSRAIYAAVIAMASALDLPVVAEGVETEDQVRQLQELGCNLAQGFYFGRPAAAEAIDALLEPALEGRGPMSLGIGGHLKPQL
jgi:diguanylate cyclase (GGDEF)-like protein/PAS domain S-box-containing protein